MNRETSVQMLLEQLRDAIYETRIDDTRLRQLAAMGDPDAAAAADRLDRRMGRVLDLSSIEQLVKQTARALPRKFEASVRTLQRKPGLRTVVQLTIRRTAYIRFAIYDKQVIIKWVLQATPGSKLTREQVQDIGTRLVNYHGYGWGPAGPGSVAGTLVPTIGTFRERTSILRHLDLVEDMFAGLQRL